jgi:hypothetical protein
MENTQLETLARAIAAELGADWKYREQDEPYPTHRIDGPGEATLYLRIEYNAKDRIAIGGSLNIGKHGQYVTVYDEGKRVNAPDITVAISRGVSAIVKEILRRLLPDYLRILALAVGRRDAERTYEAKRRENLETLAALACTTVRAGDDVSSFSFYHNDSAYGDVQASDSTVQLKLSSLTLEQAKDIVEYITNGRAL